MRQVKLVARHQQLVEGPLDVDQHVNCRSDQVAVVLRRITRQIGQLRP